MTQSGNNPPKFTIRRIDRDPPTPPATPPEPQPVAETPPAPPPEPQRPPTPTPATQPPIPTVSLESVSRDRTGARFRSASAVLAFLGSVFSAEIVDAAVVRRSPQRLWWVELNVACDRICPLIWTSRRSPLCAQRFPMDCPICVWGIALGRGNPNHSGCERLVDLGTGRASR